MKRLAASALDRAMLRWGRRVVHFDSRADRLGQWVCKQIGHWERSDGRPGCVRCARLVDP